MPVPRLLLDLAEEDPDHPLVWFEGDTLSRGDVAAAALKVTGWLQREGFRPGDRAGVMVLNRPEFYPIWLGVNLAGMPMVPFNAALRGDDLAYQLGHCEASVLFIEWDLLPELR